MTTFGAVLLRIESGKSVKTQERPARADEFGILRVSAVTWGEFNPRENKAILPGYDPGDCPRPMRGDLLISRANTVDLVGAPVVVAQDHPNLLLSDKILRLVPDAKVADARYLLRALRAPSTRRHFAACAGGTSGSMQNISQGDIRDTPLLLPPLNEQQRIAAILDMADAIWRKRKEAIALTEELLRATFLEMFGDPAMNLKSWQVEPLENLTAGFEAGWSANSESRPARDDEYGVLKISAVTSGWFLPEENKAVSQEVLQDGRVLVTPRRGDLLFSRANTRELVAACCIVEQDEPRLFLPDKLWRIMPNRAVARVEYLRHLLADPIIRGRIAQQATGTSGSMLNVSMEKVRRLEVPVPPIELQERFANYLWRAYAIRERQEHASYETQALFASLVHRAFRGEL